MYSWRMICSGALALFLCLALPSIASAAMDPDPTSYDWGNIDRHQQTPQQIFKFTNLDANPVTPTASVSGADAADFIVANDGCTSVIVNSGNNCSVAIYVSPSRTGQLNAELDVDDGIGLPTAVPLTATSVTGTLGVNPDPITFDPQPWFFGSQNINVNVQIQNYGVAVSGVQITGPDQGLFSINYGNCAGTTFQSGNNCSVGVGFNPTSASGPAQANLVITSDESASPRTIPITADALTGPVPQLSPTSKDFGPVALGSSSTVQTFTMTNVGDYPSQVQQILVISGTPQAFPLSNDTCTLQVVLPGNSCTFKVAFAPASLGSKEASIFVIGNGPSPVTQVGLSGQGYSPPAADAVIDGTPAVGETLSCRPVGTNGELSFSWLRDGAPIAGESEARYTLDGNDLGTRISCRIAAANPLGSDTAESPQTAPVAARNLSDDSHSLVDEASCRIVAVDPFAGVEISGTDPATPDSQLTFSAAKSIDVKLGSLNRSGKRVRFTPRQLSLLADGPQALSIDGKAGQAVLAPCKLSGQVSGSPGGRTTYALSGSSGIQSGEIHTPKLTIRTGGHSVGEVTVYAHGSPTVRFPIGGKSTTYNGIRVKLSPHSVKVDGLFEDTGAVQVDLDRNIVHGSGGKAKAKATLEGQGVARAAFLTGWRK